MKTYTFKLPKNNDSAKNYKDALMGRVINAYPWLTAESKFDYPYSNDGIEYATGGDYLTLGVSKTHNLSWLPRVTGETGFAASLLGFDRYNNVNFDLETEFSSALAALNRYAVANHPFDLGYDFTDMLGQPVKIYDNFIQIGYEVIHTTPGYFRFLKPKQKKLIIDITIKVKNNRLF